MHGMTTDLDRRFHRLEEVMDMTGDSNALTMLINYAGYNEEVIDWLEREYDL